ncbi:hypothetical protein D3C81_1994960 [compost metagenome]
MPFPVGRGCVDHQRLLVFVFRGHIFNSIGCFDGYNRQKGYDNDRDDNPDRFEYLVALLMLRNVAFIALFGPVFHKYKDV